MTKTRTRKIKIAAYVEPEFREELVTISQEFGITIGQAMNMVLRMGYFNFMRAYKPEKVLDKVHFRKLVSDEEVKLEKAVQGN